MAWSGYWENFGILLARRAHLHVHVVISLCGYLTLVNERKKVVASEGLLVNLPAKMTEVAIVSLKQRVTTSPQVHVGLDSPR